MKRRTFIQTTAGLSVTALAAQLARPLLAMPKQFCGRGQFLSHGGSAVWPDDHHLRPPDPTLIFFFVFGADEFIVPTFLAPRTNTHRDIS